MWCNIKDATLCGTNISPLGGFAEVLTFEAGFNHWQGSALSAPLIRARKTRDITGSLAYLHTLWQHIPVPQSPCVGIISQKRVICELWKRFQFHPFQTLPSFNRWLFGRQMLNWKWEAELMPTGQKRVPEDTTCSALIVQTRGCGDHIVNEGVTPRICSALQHKVELLKWSL